MPTAAHRSSLIAHRLLFAVMITAAGSASAADTQRDRLVAEGQRVYARYCVGCHGETGNGKGPAARLLVVKPRDFTSGVFKFRSTPTGTLPTDEDLYRTLTRGVYRTSMPDWGLLAERERLALVQYIKTFYPQWDTQGAGPVVQVTDPPEGFGSAAAIARGQQLYDLLECWKCHGKEGRGDGPSADSLDPDVWGNPQRPFDFTSGRLKGGPTVKDIYRTFMTGLNGTAMPSYADIFGEPDGENILEGDAWNLVSFIVSLRRNAPASTVQLHRTSTKPTGAQ
jgi:cytochrome c oxidase cbb3-type subunit 2